MWHTAWVFWRILNKWPHHRGHANANACNHAFETYLCSLWVASSFGHISSLHTNPPLGVMLSMNTLIIILCASATIVSGKVSLCLWTYNMHEVPLIFILSSLQTQLSTLISLLHKVIHACWIFILISFSCS